MDDTDNEKPTNVLPKTLNELLGSIRERQIISGLSSEEDMETEDNFEVVRSKKKKKRDRQELDVSMEDDWREALVQNDSFIEIVHKIENNIRKICANDPAKRMTQKITSDIMQEVEEMSKIVQSLLTRNAFLRGVIDGKESEISSLSKRLGQMREENEKSKQVPYLRTVTKVTEDRVRVPPITGSGKRTPALAQVVVISPKEGNGETDAEQLKQKVMSLIDPCKEGIKIKGVRKRADGKIAIETATDEDLKKKVEHSKLKEEGLKAARTGALNPKLVVYDVPRNMEPVDMVDSMHSQNAMIATELEKEVFIKDFIPRFKIGKREGQTANWVVEVSPRIRNLLRGDEKMKLFLQWRSCKVEDYRGVTRCCNCKIYEHVAKYCIQKEKTCSFCSVVGHTVAECQSKKENKKPTCAACKKAKRKADHSVNDKAYPAYKAALDRVKERTDYGNNG